MFKQRLRRLQKIGFTLLACSAFCTVAFANESPIIMSYWENWATYQGFPMLNNAQGSKNAVLQDQLAGINTLAYAFMVVDTNGNLQFSDVYSDLNSRSEQDKEFCSSHPSSCAGFPQKAGLGNFSAFCKTAVEHHAISVGGAGGDESWNRAIAHPENFVASLKAMVEHYHIDWLDIDYEPVSGIPAKNVAGFVELTNKIKKALPSLHLSYTIIANHQNIEKFGHDNWQKMNANLNYISLMGYDMHGVFDKSNPYTGLHSALVSQKNDYSVHAAVTALHKMGIANQKIILGMPLYGNAVSGVQNAGLAQKFTAGVRGDIGDQNCSTNLNDAKVCSGSIQYKSLVDQYTAIPVTIAGQIAGVYAYDANKTIFVSYDNPESASAKVQYAIDQQLAGIMLWALRFDKPIQHPQSLLSAVNKTYGSNQKA